MKTQTKEEIKKLLIVAGYEKELSDIFFIEDFELMDFNLDLDLDFNLDLEPIEMEELY